MEKQDKKNERVKKPENMTYYEKIAARVVNVLGGTCSTKYVQMVLQGERNDRTAKAQEIKIAAAVIAEEENRIVNAVRNLIMI